MKNLRNIAFVLGLVSMVFFQGCIQDKCNMTRTYMQYTPIYMGYDEFREAFGKENSRSLENPGKLWFQGNYIFVSEVNKGVHIIDNSNPASPINIAFLNVPGNRDIAAKGHMLYADSHIDLLAIDISDPVNPVLAERIEDVFPYMTWNNGYSADPAIGVVTEWIGAEITEEIDCDAVNNGGWGWGVPWLENGIFLANDVSLQTGTGGGSGGNNTAAAPQSGVGGSMARFALHDEYLYAVTDRDMKLFDISNLADPNFHSDVPIGWQIETIFPYNEHMFIGSRTGMIIYDVSTPTNPLYVSDFAHVNSCDPVVVQDDRAYVTLRGGTPCNSFTNQLDVLDISNLQNPFLITSYDMKEPYGLGIDGSTLFVCDGDAGLKVYDATDDLEIDKNKLAQFEDINAFDVIPLNGLLLMIGSDGLYQYDYTDQENIDLVSVIPVVK